MREPFLRVPQSAVQALLGGANTGQLARYVLISGLAFALDLTVFLQLLPLGVSQYSRNLWVVWAPAGAAIATELRAATSTVPTSRR